MSPELTDKLYKDFPKIFLEKDLSPKYTCMCWGFECDDGWFNLIYNLCNFLQWHIDKNNHPQIIAKQVKEKFGTLRFYYSSDGKNDSYLSGAISFAETMSGNICEITGNPGNLYVKSGWYKTLSKEKADELGYSDDKNLF